MFTHLPIEISVIKTGQRFTEFILLFKVQARNDVKVGKGGEAGFGSSDAHWMDTSHMSTATITHFVYKWKKLFWSYGYW